ncbi:hypothetical protein XELAEV_18029366mg [Xenopus laevis]|uniref:Uncharacterized protein n=1 Tax=Xenopus laevis TaxID=8355 RepID=A0A974HI07_XENLA|nr:hypothetical protein XELAEV_18029366mg [Xenopus laevis]
MVLRTTHKRHMIPAPPAVSSVPNTDAPQSRHHILRKQQNSFKPLGRPCTPFHSIPQTANAGVCRLLGVQWNGKECSFHHALKCANVYAAIFPSLSHPFTADPYLTIFFPPSASLDSMWSIDRGSKSDCL